jgi:hypothetical protein
LLKNIALEEFTHNMQAGIPSERLSCSKPAEKLHKQAFSSRRNVADYTSDEDLKCVTRREIYIQTYFIMHAIFHRSRAAVRRVA